MHTREFVLLAEIETAELDRWVSEGWLAPREDASERDFSDLDLSRAHLIRDMFGLGVNDESMPIILDLIDQLHGVRRLLRRLAISEPGHSPER